MPDSGFGGTVAQFGQEDGSTVLAGLNPFTWTTDPAVWQRIGIGIGGVALMIAGLSIVILSSKPAKEVVTAVVGTASSVAKKNPAGAVASSAVKAAV